jgi:hypothetical protein
MTGLAASDRLVGASWAIHRLRGGAAKEHPSPTLKRRRAGVSANRFKAGKIPIQTNSTYLNHQDSNLIELISIGFKFRVSSSNVRMYPG